MKGCRGSLLLLIDFYQCMRNKRRRRDLHAHQVLGNAIMQYKWNEHIYVCARVCINICSREITICMVSIRNICKVLDNPMQLNWCNSIGACPNAHIPSHKGNRFTQTTHHNHACPKK